MKSTTKHDYQERMRRVLCHIQHNLDSTLRLEELAKLAHFSPFHFHRVFRGMLGESVQQHVRRLRLERAAQRLKYTDTAVTRLAFEAGYETHESFTRAFGAAFGCSPSSHRAEGASTQLPCLNGVHFSAASECLNARFTEKLMNTVEVVTLPALRVAAVPHQGDYSRVGEAWEQLLDWAGEHCLFGPAHPHIGACWDDPEVTPAEEIRYEACLPISEEQAVDERVQVREFAGGRFARVVHEGPYDELGHTYATLFGVWFATHSYEPAPGPSYEYYLNDPDNTEAEDLLTEICVRIL